MSVRHSVVLMLATVSVLFLLLALETAFAEPPALAPTEEPTKAPYVFPTPIFIPTYPNDAATGSPIRTTGATPPAAIPQSSPGGTYTVQSGDSPWTIAQKLCGSGAKWSIIVTANNIADATRIRIGTVLKIPSDCATASAARLSPTPPPPPPAATPTNMTVASTLATPSYVVRTPTPSTGASEPITWFTVGTVIINVGSGLMMMGSVLSGASAFLVYRRARFIDEMTHMVRRLRVRSHKPPYT